MKKWEVRFWWEEFRVRYGAILEAVGFVIAIAMLMWFLGELWTFRW